MNYRVTGPTHTLTVLDANGNGNTKHAQSGHEILDGINTICSSCLLPILPGQPLLLCDACRCIVHHKPCSRSRAVPGTSFHYFTCHACGDLG